MKRWLKLILLLKVEQGSGSSRIRTCNLTVMSRVLCP